MQAVILAGGLGSRLSERTRLTPKPMLEVGNKPLIWHIMQLYSHYGVHEFFLALGHRSEAFKRYFLDYHRLSGSLTVNLGDGTLESYTPKRLDWTVHLIDTGVSTQTGGRLKRLASWLRNDTFFMTYGDAVADIDLERLLDHHQAQRRIATVTAVQPSPRFGRLIMNGTLVRDFLEKSDAHEPWISGGFFVLEPAVFDYIDDDDTVFEQAPLQRLAQDGQLAAYEHRGFWQCVDTQPELTKLERLWDSDSAPWKMYAD